MSSTDPKKNEPLLEARPTQRLGNQRIAGDGDTWQETLAVCEAPSAVNATTTKSKGKSSKSSSKSASAPGKLIIRSYFENTRTGKRAWDEPPSGASVILPATQEMRRMAELQLAELQIVTESTTETEEAKATAKAKGQDAAEPKKRRGFFGFGKKKETSTAPAAPPPKIRYRPGSSLLTPAPRHSSQDADVHLQEAIARSLAESQGIPYSATTSTAATSTVNDDDELAIATALSLSVAHAQQAGETEEQLVARVLEESRIEAAIKRGAYQAALSELEPTQPMQPSQPRDLLADDDLDDRKPAAIPPRHHQPVATFSHSQQQQQQKQQQLHPINVVAPSAYAYAQGSKFTNTNNAKSPPHSPISPRFDPYAKDAPMPTDRIATQTEKAVSSLQKMDVNANTSPSRLSVNWGKRTSQKIKDQAGLL